MCKDFVLNLSSWALKTFQGLYIFLVFLEVKGAFDDVEWRDILQQLIILNCPGNITGFIRTYLSNNSILVNWGAALSRHQ